MEDILYLLGPKAWLLLAIAMTLPLIGLLGLRWISKLRKTKKQRRQISNETSSLLESKRMRPQHSSPDRSSSLMKILDPVENANDADESIQIEGRHAEETSSAPRPPLPPPPVREAAKGLQPSKTEAILLQMCDEYIKGIHEFQVELQKSTCVSEVLGRSCRALSSLAGSTRVVFLEYKSAQRSLMVNSRSTPEVFSGTQPRMFLPLKNAASEKSVSASDLRKCFESLGQDNELQRLLKDACLMEAPAEGEISQDLIWASRAPWRIFPLYLRGVPQGVFAIQESSVCQRKEFVSLAQIQVQQASVAIENLKLHLRMSEIASRDGVTGLLSRKAFQDRLYEAFLISRRLQHPMTLLRIEVPHMALYKKKYGTQIFDAILRHVARHFQRTFRKSDILGRFGDEGFAVLLPHTALVDAMTKSENLVQAVQDSNLKVTSMGNVNQLKVKICAGLAEFPSHADSPSELLRFAGEALYRGLNQEKSAVTLAKVSTGYVPPFNSRFVRSAPKALHENHVQPIVDG